MVRECKARQKYEVGQRCRVEQGKMIRQNALSLNSGGKTSFFFGVDMRVLNTNDK